MCFAIRSIHRDPVETERLFQILTSCKESNWFAREITSLEGGIGMNRVLDKRVLYLDQLPSKCSKYSPAVSDRDVLGILVLHEEGLNERHGSCCERD